MLEDFKQHPAVAPLIAGGKLVEYAAHVVPEAGMNMQPELVGDGVLIAGDAAGMCMNLGFTIRGMDLAISAGEAAAKTVLSAMKSDDFSKQSLDEYRQHLDEGPMRDMRMYRNCQLFLIIPACLPLIPKWRSVSRTTCSPWMAPLRCRCVKNPAPCEESGLHQPDERWPERSDRIMTSPVNVDVKLGVNKFNVDEDSPHIILKPILINRRWRC